MIKIVFIPAWLLFLQHGYGQPSDKGSVDLTDTLQNNTISPNLFKIKKLHDPVFLLIAGISLNGNGCESLKNEIVEERNEHWQNFRTHIDDYVQYSPVVIAYGLDVLGVKSKTDILNRTAILLKGEGIMIATTHVLKKATHIQRPDRSNYASFPSGHTAQAFAAATFLSEEYQHRLKWMPYISYGIAASVGALRMANNKHFISDVLAGAGIGILSVKLSYWTHQYKWHRQAVKSPRNNH